MARDAAEAGGGLTLVRHAVEHAAGAEDVAVDGRHGRRDHHDVENGGGRGNAQAARSEEHTSELQSQSNLVCRLLLEKKKKKKKRTHKCEDDTDKKRNSTMTT